MKENNPLHNTEAEKAVLCELMHSSLAQFADVRDLFNSNSFYDSKNRIIYESLCELSDEGKELSVPFLTQKVSTKPNAPTMAELCVLYALPPIADFQLPYYARLLRELAQKREIQRIGSDLVHCGTNEGSDIESAVERADEALKSLFADEATNTITMHEVLTEVHQRINENLSGIVQRGSLTGFRWLDEKGGFQKSDLILICGASSMGKTAFALSVTNNVIAEGEKVAFYSMEMTRAQLVSRLLASMSKVSSNKILNSRLSDFDWLSVNKSIGEVDRYAQNLFFDDRSTSNADTILNSIRTMVLKYGVKGAVIDYLQILNVNMKNVNKEQAMGDIARRLKNLAKELDIWILALSQLNRDKENPRPTLDRIRDSGQIAEASDVVMMVYRPEYYNTTLKYPSPHENVSTHETAMIDVVKGRNIGTGSFIVGFSPETTSFYELDGMPEREETKTYTFDCPY